MSDRDYRRFQLRERRLAESLADRMPVQQASRLVDAWRDEAYRKGIPRNSPAYRRDAAAWVESRAAAEGQGGLSVEAGDEAEADLARLLAVARDAMEAEAVAWSAAGWASDPQALRRLHQAVVRLGAVADEVGESHGPGIDFRQPRAFPGCRRRGGPGVSGRGPRVLLARIAAAWDGLSPGARASVDPPGLESAVEDARALLSAYGGGDAPARPRPSAWAIERYELAQIDGEAYLARLDAEAALAAASGLANAAAAPGRAKREGGGMSELWLPRGTVWVDTASGSRYRIDPAAGTWARESHDPRSDLVRSPGGPLLGLAAPPRVGLPAVIVGPGLADPELARVIVTTPVVRIHPTTPAGPHAPLEGWWDGTGDGGAS